MKILKIVEPGWENYTGYLGMVEFKEAVSVAPVPQIMADRITSLVRVVEVDESGVEIQAGAAARIVGGAAIAAEVVPALEKLTEEELAAEREAAAKREVDPDSVVYKTQEDLEAIAGKEGINGLREVAKPWGVRERSIPNLIGAILKAQAEFRERSEARKAAEEAARKEALNAGNFATDKTIEAFVSGIAPVTSAEVEPEAPATVESDPVDEVKPE